MKPNQRAIAMTETVTAPQTINLWLVGRITPKSRPRFARGQAYLPSKYRQWKEEAGLELLCQLGDRSSLPLRKASVQILLSGAHRGDLDNLGGSILDTLVAAEVIREDRISCVSRLVIEHESIGELGANVLVLGNL